MPEVKALSKYASDGRRHLATYPLQGDSDGKETPLVKECNMKSRLKVEGFGRRVGLFYNAKLQCQSGTSESPCFFPDNNVLGGPAGYRERFFVKYSRSSEPCFGSR